MHLDRGQFGGICRTSRSPIQMKGIVVTVGQIFGEVGKRMATITQPDALYGRSYSYVERPSVCQHILNIFPSLTFDILIVLSNNPCPTDQHRPAVLLHGRHR